MRYLKLSTLLALAMAFALTLGAPPQPAEAGLCTQLGKGNGCVNNKDVANNKLKANDMKDEAGVDFHQAIDSIELEPTDLIIRTVTLVAPRPGFMIANASGYYVFNAASQLANCSITNLSVTDPTSEMPGANGTAGISFVPFAGTRVFQVPAGAITINLVCVEIIGVESRVVTAMLNALYVPTRY